MIHGDPGTGKSVALRLLAERLARLPDVTVGAINHPQSNLADFYRELGDIFAVPLRPHNRWGGFKALARALAGAPGDHAPARRAAHRRGAGDEPGGAVRAAPAGQRPLRLAAAAVRGAGRRCAPHRQAAREELIPLGSRIRTRLATEHASREELSPGLNHLLAAPATPA